jgi:DNA polymerase elongation subunit (family B)
MLVENILSPPVVKTTIKVKRNVSGKSFKLYDFRTYDGFIAKGGDSESSSSDGSETKVNKFESSNFIIQCFGINDRGETCSISIKDFKPFFFVKAGNTWNKSDAENFKQEIVVKLGDYYGKQVKSCDLVEYNKLYGFSGGKKDKFVKLTFENIKVMNKVKNLWVRYEPKTNIRKKVILKSQGVVMEPYEGNIPPLLRYFHIHNISPSGWVFVDMAQVDIPSKRSTTCDYEFICKTKSIIPQPDKELQVPYKICSFDIEASSSDGDFPVPVKNYKRLAMQMVDVFSKHLKIGATVDESIKSKSITLLSRIINASFGFGKFDDIDLIYPKNKVSKKLIESKTQDMLVLNIDNIKDGENSGIMTITSLFESMRDNSALGNGCGGDDSDNENDNDNIDDVPSYPKKVTRSIYDNNSGKTTILEIILGDKHSRDDKIQILNEAMTGLFPKLEGDRVTMIGTTFVKFGEPEPYLNHCIVVGTCDPIEGAVIESVVTETNMLLKWTELIQKEKPSIIIGYNIFGFDYEFMFQRAKENNCERQFLVLSQNIDELSATDDEKTGEVSLANTQVKLASGEYDLSYPNISGTLQIDLLTYFRREDTSLSSYKLDDVAGHYISDKIVFSAPAENNTTDLYTKNITGLRVGDYIHIEVTGFTSDYYNGGQKFIIADILPNTVVSSSGKMDGTYNVIRIHGTENLGDTSKMKWCMAKDDVSVKDIFRLVKGSSTDRARVAKYCIQDCNLVHHLMNKSDILTGYIEMSKICSVPISFLVFRGQGIKLTSFVAKKCREKNTLMPDLEKSFDNEGFEGAIVLPPKCALYMDNPVACVDYSSLYPSSMISQNYSHDSKVWTREFDLEGNMIQETGEKNRKGEYIYDNLPGYEYINIDFDTFKYIRSSPTARAIKTKIGKKTCRWAQLPNNQKSIMPAILEELLKARADTRKKIKQESDPFMQNVLDKRQLGYKVTANSLYGQCGAKTSTFYDVDVAASTTATGRMMIMYAKQIIEDVYNNMEYTTKCHGSVMTHAEYVYGDTDSVFFTFNLRDTVTDEKITGKKALEITIEIAQDAANLCSQFLKPPMCLTYEKTLMPFVLLSKKRYVGMLYEEDANKGKLKYMGLSLKRRDSCDYLKDTYGGILNILMNDNNVEKAIDFLNNSLTELIVGNVHMDKLAITKALRGYYKNPGTIAHSVLANRIGRRDSGNKPKPGDRIKFVHIVIANKKALQGEKIETPEFITQNKVPIDYAFYITNQLMKPLQQLFGLALDSVIVFKKDYKMKLLFKSDMIKLDKECGDLELFMKKKEKYCSAKVKELLFDPYLQDIFNKQNGIQRISDMFAPRKK